MRNSESVQKNDSALAAANDTGSDTLEERVRGLGRWFHNMNLAGIATAPDHFLGDYPNVKWKQFSAALPSDLSGMTVLDIGCNGGFYSIEMKRRGARRVVGIDSDERYLAQARLAASVRNVEIDFRRMSVYDVGVLGKKFDIVLMMGVLYHLRHPLLALDLIHEHVAGDLLVFQSMLRGADECEPLQRDYDISEQNIFNKPGFPKLHFIENRYSGDVTNWWIPNRACAEAMLRSAGFNIISHPEEEVYVCTRKDLLTGPQGPNAVYPAKGNFSHD
jgi:tRNA (mo5U34)-methyltransferase